MSIIVYGIPNCDTVKKARLWLEERGIPYQFHDYKKQGADPKQIAGWIEAAGIGRVLNTAGTTFKKLPDDVKARMSPELMAEYPSTIRRPIVEHDGGLLVGFKPEEWKAALTV